MSEALISPRDRTPRPRRDTPAASEREFVTALLKRLSERVRTLESLSES
ncbi:hypothetical protein [Lyngbya sp. CCY1209]|nr:hypothetical protein [Lyngbya sp. CCY1209]MEB3884649.1 hypothetical protein [Lyngbya sp. CCY1209]